MNLRAAAEDKWGTSSPKYQYFLGRGNYYGLPDGIQ
jgi:hypothetical protein